MIDVATGEMVGSDRVSDLKRLRASLGWYGTYSNRAKWRAPPSARSSVRKKYLTPPTLLEMAGLA